MQLAVLLSPRQRIARFGEMIETDCPISGAKQDFGGDAVLCESFVGVRQSLFGEKPLMPLHPRHMSVAE